MRCALLPPFSMSKLTNINAIFQKANDTFGPITAKPRDADLHRLNETLVVCTLSITLTGRTAGCASDVFLPEAVYQRNHRGAFNFCANAALVGRPVCPAVLHLLDLGETVVL